MSVATAWQGMPYIGVAIPFGTIVGLIAYLFYYAIFTSGGDDETKVNPFGADRMLQIGIVAAILAHYVEIHFGIAIAATRIYFFAYLAVLFVVGYLLPKLKEEENVEELITKKGKKRKVRRSSKQDEGWLPPILGAAFIMALIIGIMGYDYMTTSLPDRRGDGMTFASVEEVQLAYSLGKIDTHANITVKLPPERTIKGEREHDGGPLVPTTVGRVIFNTMLPEGMPFYNIPLRSSDLATVISD